MKWLWLGGVLVAVTVLVAAYYWPTRSRELALEPLTLPTEALDLPSTAVRQEAEELVETLIQRFPNSSDAHHVAAVSHQNLKQLDAAISHWEKCLALNPSDAIAYRSLAEIQIKKGQDRDAARTLLKAIDAGLASAEIFHEYVNVLQRLNQLAEGENVASSALKTYPNSPQLWIDLGQTQVQRERLVDARNSFNEALKIDPDSTTAHFGAAGVCQRLGELDAATAHRRIVEKKRAVLERGLANIGEDHDRSLKLLLVTMLSAAGKVYDDHGETAEGERLNLRALAINPSSVESCQQLANMYNRDRKFEHALTAQRRLLEIEPDNPMNYTNVASLSFAVGQMKEGEAALLAAAEKFPEDPRAMDALALIYVRTGRPAQARDFAERAIRVMPLPERYQVLSSACKQLGDFAAAQSADQAALEMTSQHQ